MISLAYETKITSLLAKGYVLTTSTDELTTLGKAMRSLRITTKIAGKHIFGDNLFQKSLNTTALAALVMDTTAATATSVVETFGANTFIKTASSSNYTLNTTTKVLSATDPELACVVVSNNYTVTAPGYIAMKVTEQVGSVKFSVSRDGGTTFTQLYPSSGVIVFNQPAGTSFCFKIEFTGTATVKGIGFALR